MSNATLAVDRGHLLDWYRRNRERSASLFALVDDATYTQRPIALRHPFVFYQGHLPAFSYLTLNERSLGQAPINPTLEKLFERGIDPSSEDAARAHDRSYWPEQDAVERFARECDERVEAAISTAEFVSETNPRLIRGQALYTVLEHEQMHHETLVYIIHQVSQSHKGRIEQQHYDHRPPENQWREIAPGVATLGAVAGEQPFGWDNEFAAQMVAVPAFHIQQFPVTNADWLAFVEAGGPVPNFWLERDGEYFLRGVFDELPLPLSWPVYVTNQQAQAYAQWRGFSLPTEAQYHRAAFGTPNGNERAFPWGDAPPHPLFGNFDFARFDPEPVDAHAAGASAWDVHDLIGNGWEWTSTPFAPLPGFEPMASYPQYSADFFDGRHYVMKGASPVTALELIRRSFRNWFYDDYPYMYAKFRLVSG